MNNIVLAADLGGTNLRMSAIDCAGEILFQTKSETPRSDSSDAIISAIIGAAKECLQFVNGSGTVKGVAVAVPGTVNTSKGIILNAPNLPALNGFPITEALETELGLPGFLENDANAAAIGEKWCGGSKEFNDSICITLGTGVGGGIILGGKLVRGIDGTAGEIGHIGVEPFGAPCGCGSRGCLEQYASATAVVRLLREISPSFPNSILDRDLDYSSEQIFEAGKAGDSLAIEVFRLQGFYLGIALSGLINLLNPEVIVIGGGASAAWELFIPETKRIIGGRTYREPRERAKIIPAEKGDDAGVLGVAHLAFEIVSELS